MCYTTDMDNASWVDRVQCDACQEHLPLDFTRCIGGRIICEDCVDSVCQLCGGSDTLAKGAEFCYDCQTIAVDLIADDLANKTE